MADITNMEDVLVVRDIIARVEELRTWAAGSQDEGETESLSTEDRGELDRLEALLSDLKGNGGDEQWEGDWYPVTLVRDSYFEKYAQELADDIGATPPDREGVKWPYTCIDWEEAAKELQIDYTSCEYDGVTYWFR